ncbi:MAG TPA: MFS transporter [Rhodopila sp.]|uniref:MFS transporter n=1 Tax=Rhodopila sp. TaxID=2480087 RepID=UPI002BE188C4|nr:MFS transporter [Rhodopila sp.]HVY14962.1 MFS transporter [Rhodopila sp.]
MSETITATEAQATKAIFRRLVPFLMLCYFIAYVDRVNVGFAALTMNRDLGFSSTVFGTGAGIFFLGYFIFEIPSNLAVARFGAGRWMMRIMLTWGIIAAAMAFVTGVKSFYAMRFALGLAEAGFFPGILFYLTLWFPNSYRGKIIGWFMAAIPISTIVGAPVSGLILGLDGTLGFRGWQWLYILEGLPAVILAILVPFVLTDSPERARWLSPNARTWLIARLAQERKEREAIEHFSIGKALVDPRVLLLSLVYFGAIACTFGLGFWLPQIIKGMGLTNTQTGFVTAIPYLFGMLGMLTIGRRSDRVGERRFHCAFGLVVGAAGLIASTLVTGHVATMVAFSVAAFGFLGSQPVFWAIPSSLLTGAAAAGGLALINAVGGLAGFLGPFVVGAIKDATGSYSWGMVAIAACAVVAAVIVVALGESRAATAPAAMSRQSV